jgi:hypothetical protein
MSDPVHRYGFGIPDAIVFQALTLRERVQVIEVDQVVDQLAGRVLTHQPLSFTEMGELVRAADRAGIPLGEWAAAVLLSAARLALLGSDPKEVTDQIPW